MHQRSEPNSHQKGARMSEQPESNKKPNENPLEEWAAEASESLSGGETRMRESSADHVSGGQVSMFQSAARRVETSALHMEESAAALVRAGSVEADDSSIALATARRLTVSESNASILVGQEVQAEDVRVGLLLAARVEGSVRTLFSPRTALAFGMGIGAGFALLRQLFVLANRE